MSFWLWGRKQRGQRHVYSVSISLFAILMAVGVLLALLFSIIQALR